MPRKSKIDDPLSLEEREEWRNFCDDVDGKYEPMEAQDINIAHEVDNYLSLFGGRAVVEATYRAECSCLEEDREDWNEVVRIIKVRLTEIAEKK